MVSALKVNFHKSCLFGINVVEVFLAAASSFLCCKVGELPFTYLGLPVGANPRRAKTWQPVVDVLRKRLTRWRGRHLSLGGRIVLLKSILSSIPLYFLSLFRIPRKVLTILIGIQRNFLWGGGDGKRSISWVKWNRVCAPKDLGGLRVKDLDVFNLILLGKWRWRLLVDPDVCWHNILVSRYGVPCTKPNTQVWDSKNSSSWWRDLCAIDSNSVVVQHWLSNEVRRKVGNGDSILVWHDVWFGVKSLKEEFPRLFSLPLDKDSSVAKMGCWDGNVWRWRWRRALFAWEDEALWLFSATMDGAYLCRDKDDVWIWLVGNSNFFTVKATYDLLLSLSLSHNPVSGMSGIFKNFWISCVPSKVLAFSWQLLLDRLPSRVNLFIRQVILDPSQCVCVLCGLEQKSALHLFLLCPFTRRVWDYVYTWLGFNFVVQHDISSMYSSHRQLFRGKKVKKFRSIFWHSTVCSLWLMRNEIIFKNGQVDFLSVLEQINHRSWQWFSAGCVSLVYIYTDWCLCPVGRLS